MSTLIGTILAAVATAAAGIVAMKVSRLKQRRDAEKDVEEAEKEQAEKKAGLRKAIFEKNDAEVNQKLAKLLMVVAVGFGIIGCETKKVVEYVASDRRIVSVTNEYGVACKAVPDVVFAEITDKLIELEELKKQQKVEKRLGQ